MSTEGQEIHKRLAAVLADVGAISKERTNQAQNFKFRGVDDVYNELHDHFAKQGIYVAPEVLEYKQAERQTAKGGTQLHTVVKMRYRFIAADGSSVAMEVPGEAADSGDKGLGKACQYAYKLLLLQMFLIPTEGDNDPDAHATEWGRSERKSTRQPLPPVRPVAPQPSATGDEVLVPWLRRIDAAAEAGDEARLDAVRDEINALPDRPKGPHATVIRRAIEAARIAIRAKMPETKTDKAGFDWSNQ